MQKMIPVNDHNSGGNSLLLDMQQSIILSSISNSEINLSEGRENQFTTKRDALGFLKSQNFNLNDPYHISRETLRYFEYTPILERDIILLRFHSSYLPFIFFAISYSKTQAQRDANDKTTKNSLEIYKKLSYLVSMQIFILALRESPESLSVQPEKRFEKLQNWLFPPENVILGSKINSQLNEWDIYYYAHKVSTILFI